MSVEVQWTDTDPVTGDRRFVRAERFAGRWTIRIRVRRRGVWTAPPVVTRSMWETLLDGLQRRFSRREGVTEGDLQVVRDAINATPKDASP